MEQKRPDSRGISEIESRISITCMKCEYNAPVHNEVLMETPSENGFFKNPLDNIPGLLIIPDSP